MNIEKLDSLQATEVRNTFIAQPPEPQLLQWISESVLHALGDGGKGQKKSAQGVALLIYVFKTVCLLAYIFTTYTFTTNTLD